MGVAGEGRKCKGLQEWRSCGSCGGGWLSVRASEVQPPPMNGIVAPEKLVDVIIKWR